MRRLSILNRSRLRKLPRSRRASGLRGRRGRTASLDRTAVGYVPPGARANNASEMSAFGTSFPCFREAGYTRTPSFAAVAVPVRVNLPGQMDAVGRRSPVRPGFRRSTRNNLEPALTRATAVPVLDGSRYRRFWEGLCACAFSRREANRKGSGRFSVCWSGFS